MFKAMHDVRMVQHRVELRLVTRVVGERVEDIPSRAIDTALRHFAEFEVLDMPGHDEHYKTLGSGQLGKIGLKGTFPIGSSWAAQHRRSVASNVVGNIGESVGVAVLMHLSGLTTSNVLRLGSRSASGGPARATGLSGRIPDFAVSSRSQRIVRRSMATLVDLFDPGEVRSDHSIRFDAPRFLFPSRFPIESKASFESGDAFWSGTWQLVEYWRELLRPHNDRRGVGFGAVIQTQQVGAAERSVRISLFAPRDQNEMCSKLSANLPQDATKKSLESYLGSVPFIT